MKKILYVALFFALALETQAQITYSIGIKGGPVFGRFKNYNLEGSRKSSLGGQFTSRVGGGGGVNAKVWFNKFVGLNLGVEFNMGGNTQKAQQNFPGNNFRERIWIHKFHYITIPLVAHVGWGNDRLRAYGTAGGYYAIPVHGRFGYQEYINKNLVVDNREDADFDNTYSKMDAGIRFGAGFEVYVSKNRKHGVSFDATYDWGLTKVYRDVIDDLDEKTKFTNSRVNIQIGYLYRFGVKSDKTTTASKTKPSTEKTKTEKTKKEPKTKEPKKDKSKEEKPEKTKKEKVMTN